MASLGDRQDVEVGLVLDAPVGLVGDLDRINI